MTFEYIVDRSYWCAIILSSIAYLALNFDAYDKTRKKYMLYMAIVSLTMFGTSTTSFLLRHSTIIRGNLYSIRLGLLMIPVIRVPIDLWLYSRLLKDFNALSKNQRSSEKDENKAA